MADFVNRDGARKWVSFCERQRTKNSQGVDSRVTPFLESAILVDDDHFSCAGHAETGARAWRTGRGRGRNEREHEVVRIRNGHFNRTTVVIRSGNLRSDVCAAHCRSAFRARSLTLKSAAGDYHFRGVDARRSYAPDISGHVGKCSWSSNAGSRIRGLATGDGFIPVAVVASNGRVPRTLFRRSVNMMINKDGVTKAADSKNHTDK